MPAAPTAVDLRTENRSDPAGIDGPSPRLSWRIPEDDTPSHQVAYRIRVRSGGPDGPEVWDTGRVDSRATYGIAYAGAPLTPRTSYWWQVRIWSGDGEPGGWSAPATWLSGLMGRPWPAQWITTSGELALAAPGLDSPRPTEHVWRIWPQDQSRADPTAVACFRTVVHVPPGSEVSRATFHFGGLDDASLWINGTAWDPAASDITGALVIGRNVIAVSGTGDELRPGGLAGRVDVLRAGKEAITRITGDDWRATSDAAGDWQEPGYDDDAWPLAVRCELHGHPPLGREPVTYRPSPYLRRAFAVESDVASAHLYITALGLYEATVNGEPVSGDKLNPGWTDYATRVPYHVYDVTNLLVKGDNCLAVVLGDGWYAGWISWLGQFHYGLRRALRAELVVTDADGRSVSVASDENWTGGAGPIRFADLQNGEVVDARYDDPLLLPATVEWGTAASVLHPAAGAVEAAVAPPVRVLHTLRATSVQDKGAGRWIVDFGQNIAGWVRVAATAPAGHRMLVRYAEMLDEDGELHLDSMRGARATDEYTFRGDPRGERFEPRFTYHGFRYAEITGHPGALDVTRIEALAVHADMERTGSFACSNEALERLHQNVVWSMRGNFLSVPTDCPQRDERLGWTGDAQVFAETASFLYDTRSFYQKWLQDLRDAQLPDGAVPHTAPDVLSAQETVPGVNATSAGWGDAAVIVPQVVHAAFNDPALIATSLSSMARFLEQHVTRGVGAHEYGDWLAAFETPRRFIRDAYTVVSCKTAAELAASLGHAEQAARWRELHDRQRRTFRRRYVRGGGRLHIDHGRPTQTAYVLALRGGAFEPHELDHAVDQLVADIERRDFHLTTGFLGTPWLLAALSDHGRFDVAYRLLLQESHPSWLFPVLSGDATTIWERWNAWSPDGGFADSKMTSFNHYAFGAVAAWMHRNITGIQALSPGYDAIRLAPRPGGGLTWAKGELRSRHGRIGCEWRIDGDRFRLTAVIPPNVTAEIVFPPEASRPATPAGDAVDAVHVAGPGRHEFHAAYRPLAAPARMEHRR